MLARLRFGAVRLRKTSSNSEVQHLLGRISRHHDGTVVKGAPRPVRYVSTRGEAPPLGFADVALSGLAPDGGLYVPHEWPVFEPDCIAGLCGRPYAEVAFELIRPFVGDAVAEHDLARMTREAYGTFRHPAVAPLV